MQHLKMILGFACICVVFVQSLPCSAGEVGSGREITEEEAEKIMATQHFLTGLDIAWWAQGGKDSLGPGLMWGLVLIQEKLEMELTIHSLVSGKINSIPIDLIFKVPFRVGLWLVPYFGVGPMLIIDRTQSRTWHDFAIAAAGGIAVNIPGFDWRIFLEGNYNFRFWEEVAHQGGGTFGFQYRF
ncbi:MAG: hypothetical protein GY854_23235 [Deltaproteobacteria bacterium]|nr:hypothetical protein [Deltaproteobacteria bacterium]